MNCQNCHQPVEAGAAYCGNCGQAQMAAQPVMPVANLSQAPAYAVALPVEHAGETKALLSLLLGIIGIVGSLFMALVGLSLGIAGLVLGTMARSSPRKRLSLAGILISSLAIIGSLAVWTYNVKHDPTQTAHADQNSIPATVSAELSTPCYSISLVNKFNVNNSAPSCDMRAYNGQTMDNSSDAYKIYANKSQIADARAFTSVAKQALEKDIKSNLPSFTIDSEQVSSFAGSPAYMINVSSSANGIAVVEAAVLHKVGTGDNVFILVHATNAATADLSTLEAQWQWK